jgi:hypothetical protein
MRDDKTFQQERRNKNAAVLSINKLLHFSLLYSGNKQSGNCFHANQKVDILDKVQPAMVAILSFLGDLLLFHIFCISVQIFFDFFDI